MKRFALCAVLLLAACSTNTIPLVVELPLPEPLILPTISHEELDHVDDDVYTRLVIIFRMLKERNKTLRNIILTTHE